MVVLLVEFPMHYNSECTCISHHMWCIMGEAWSQTAEQISYIKPSLIGSIHNG